MDGLLTLPDRPTILNGSSDFIFPVSARALRTLPEPLAAMLASARSLASTLSLVQRLLLWQLSLAGGGLAVWAARRRPPGAARLPVAVCVVALNQLWPLAFDGDTEGTFFLYSSTPLCCLRRIGAPASCHAAATLGCAAGGPGSTQVAELPSSVLQQSLPPLPRCSHHKHHRLHRRLHHQREGKRGSTSEAA